MPEEQMKTAEEILKLAAEKILDAEEILKLAKDLSAEKQEDFFNEILKQANKQTENLKLRTNSFVDATEKLIEDIKWQMTPNGKKCQLYSQLSKTLFRSGLGSIGLGTGLILIALLAFAATGPAGILAATGAGLLLLGGIMIFSSNSCGEIKRNTPTYRNCRESSEYYGKLLQIVKQKERSVSMEKPEDPRAVAIRLPHTPSAQRELLTGTLKRQASTAETQHSQKNHDAQDRIPSGKLGGPS